MVVLGAPSWWAAPLAVEMESDPDCAVTVATPDRQAERRRMRAIPRTVRDSRSTRPGEVGPQPDGSVGNVGTHRFGDDGHQVRRAAVRGDPAQVGDEGQGDPGGAVRYASPQAATNAAAAARKIARFIER